MNKKAQMVDFLTQEHLLQQIILNYVNNAVQDFADPITSTLIYMATSPVQVIFCEEGILLFKTQYAPIFPYSVLEDKDKQFLLDYIQNSDESQMTETYNGCGKYAVQVDRGHYGFIPKKNLLMAFIQIMMSQNEIKDKLVLQRLTDIIIQRFLSAVSVHSDDINLIMEKLWVVQPDHCNDDQSMSRRADSVQ